ncbi:MAG: DNA-directed RNA polymerase subunit H [Candidatus Pacearchaeota archaeon]|nr:DNA-directed RNA polymerase subunit H [Candidatus Pacearchaeota archaeon]
MHILQPKHTKLKPNEAEELLKKYNISASQLPKIRLTDPCVPEGCKVGDILKIERKEEGNVNVYFRVVA